MRDPIDELENFDPGPAMTPMPAADVRRRGNRIRRRNNALATVGGLAAVAAIAVPFAVFAGGQNSSAPPQPAPSTVEWQTSVPETFDLTAGLPDATVDDRYERQAAEVCEGEGWSAESDPRPVDLQQAIHLQSEGGWDRTLAVYADDTAAAQALAAVRTQVEECVASTAGQDRSVEVVGGTDSFVYVDHLDEAGSMYANRIVQVGNALLVESAFSMGGGDPEVVSQAIHLFEEKSEPVVAQMCVFSADGCDSDAETAEDPAIGEGAVPAIPEDFPLAAGLPSTESFGELVPSPEPRACDETAPAPNEVEKARAQWRSVSEIRDRQLLTFASQAEAEAYVQAVVGVFCVEDDHGQGFTRITRVYPGELGDYSAAAVGHNELDGEVSEGLILTEVVRVGRAVLLYQRIDEPYTFTDDVDRESTLLMDEGFQELEPVVEAMCTFTETGC